MGEDASLQAFLLAVARLLPSDGPREEEDTELM